MQSQAENMQDLLCERKIYAFNIGIQRLLYLYLGRYSLTNPQLLVDLPSGPRTNHQGGKLKIGPDNQLYVVVGEMQREGQTSKLSKWFGS